MFLINRVKKIIESFKKPVWLQWNWFPKEGEPPTQSIFEILIYLFVSIYCYCLFVDFNKIIRQTFIISAEKLIRPFLNLNIEEEGVFERIEYMFSQDDFPPIAFYVEREKYMFLSF